MIQISYGSMAAAISILWVIIRAICFIRSKGLCYKREAQLLLVYICLIVVARFTFFPFGKVDGRIQLLIFDIARIFPFRINVLPFVYLLDYSVFKEAMLNLIGNTAMFIPIGIIWPSVYRELNTHWKIILSGIGFSLCIELLQLPFYDRVTDIDDLILNSLGFLIGYGLYLLFKRLTAKKAS